MGFSLDVKQLVRVAASRPLRAAIRAPWSDAPGLPAAVAGLRRLNEAGQQAVEETAVRLADLVDTLLDKKWSRREGRFVEPETVLLTTQQPKVASCACGSGIPVQVVDIEGQAVTLIALPVIFEQFHAAGKRPSPETITALLDEIKIYTPVPPAAEAAYREAIAAEYATLWGELEPIR